MNRKNWLITCSTIVSWHLLFALFGLSWVLPSSVRELLSSWHGSFLGRKRKKVSQAALLCLFWTVWKERNNRVFDNKELSDQGIKLVLLCNLWVWSKLCAALGSSVVDFVDWLGACWGALFFVSPSFFWLAVLAPFVYPVCVLWALFGASLFNTWLLLTYQKNI